jgi:hypothetical protein
MRSYATTSAMPQMDSMVMIIKSASWRYPHFHIVLPHSKSKRPVETRVSTEFARRMLVVTSMYSLSMI